MSPRNAVRLVALFAFASCLFGVSELARAQSIEDARTKWFEADFEGSRDEFRRVLASPSLTPAQALDAHRFLAVIHLALREDDAARAHADAAVALDPSATPPEGAPRGSDDVFRMARRRLANQRAEVTVEPRGALAPGVPVSVVARLEPAPAALASSIRLRCGGTVRVERGASVEITIVPRGDVVCVAEALSEGGATLLVVERRLGAFGTNAEANADADAPAHRRKKWPWIVGAVGVAAVVGVVVGVVATRDDRASFAGTTVVGW